MDNGYKCFKPQQRGVSLIELMVSLVIGLIVILGAGQLFLTVFNTRDQVETLGEKQAAVNFAVETLLRDIRRADREHGDTRPWHSNEEENTSPILSLVVDNRGDVDPETCGFGEKIRKDYLLKSVDYEDEKRGVLGVDISRCYEGGGKDLNGGFQELVGGFMPVSNSCDESGFCVYDEDWADGVLRVSFTLVATDPDDEESTPDPMKFFAVNRTQAVSDKPWGDDEEDDDDDDWDDDDGDDDEDDDEEDD